MLAIAYLNGPEKFTPCEIPDLDRAIRTTGMSAEPVARERDRGYRFLVRREDPEELAGLEIPVSDHSVEAAR